MLHHRQKHLVDGLHLVALHVGVEHRTGPHAVKRLRAHGDTKIGKPGLLHQSVGLGRGGVVQKPCCILAERVAPVVKIQAALERVFFGLGGERVWGQCHAAFIDQCHRLRVALKRGADIAQSAGVGVDHGKRGLCIACDQRILRDPGALAVEQTLFKGAAQARAIFARDQHDR